jgi:hypothetical protein
MIFATLVVNAPSTYLRDYRAFLFVSMPETIYRFSPDLKHESQTICSHSNRLIFNFLRSVIKTWRTAVFSPISPLI